MGGGRKSELRTRTDDRLRMSELRTKTDEGTRLSRMDKEPKSRTEPETRTGMSREPGMSEGGTNKPGKSRWQQTEEEHVFMKAFQVLNPVSPLRSPPRLQTTPPTFGRPARPQGG